MFFASEHLINHVRETTIKAGYRTDHCQISLILKTFNSQRGPGLWKFNESLLQDENYSTLIKELIVNTVEQYAAPVYSKEFMLDPSNFKEIQFTINTSLFYETLLMLIRGETVKYSKQKARVNRQHEKELNDEITHLRDIFVQTGANIDLDNLSNAQQKLEAIREPKIHGAITRSRIRWHEEGEKCSKYFLALEKRNGMRKSIQCLTTNGQSITNKKKYCHNLLTT